MSQVLGGGQDARTHTGTAKVLRVIGLHKWFGDKHILKGIDLDVTHHEVVVLIGASGSGKSTLLKTINLLERVDDGQIFLQDEDITDPRIKVDDVRARIGVVFQQYNLFPHMNVLDNVTLALRKVKKLSRGEAEQFYAVHKERPFFKDLVDFMVSGPVMIQALEGEGAIAKNRDLMGATDPKKAEKGTIRADFADSIDANAVHGSDAPETAAVEIAFFFPGMNVYSGR